MLPRALPMKEREPIHDRQPVLVALDDVDGWLREGKPGEGGIELQAILVSDKVNSPRNDEPELIEAKGGIRDR